MARLSASKQFRFLNLLGFCVVFLSTLPSFASNPQCVAGSPAPALTPNTVYDIGSGQPYTTIGAFPWSSLLPGDTVRIHPGTYNEIVGITGRGTATRPIRVVGIPDAMGNLPVITGASGVTQGSCLNPQFAHGNSERGVFWISPYGNAPYGYKPGYIEVSNLVIKDAYQGNTVNFPAGSSPATGPMASATAGVYIVSGEHIIFTNCTITGNDNGFFVNSSDPFDIGSSEAYESNDITLQYSYIYGNGVNGSSQQHNQYTEAHGMVDQFNYFGSEQSSASGNNLKDRSAGLVVRYNWFESGGHILDLVDPQGTKHIAVRQPDFPNTFIYGNVFHNTFTNTKIHYAGDTGLPQYDRTGTAYIYNNTFVTHANQSGGIYEDTVVQLQDNGRSTQTNDQTADMRNNIFFSEPATSGNTPPQIKFDSVTAGACDGYVNFGSNYIGITSSSWGDGYNLAIGACPTNVLGESNLFLDTTDNPGFNSDSTEDYTLASGSNAIGKSGGLAAAVTSNPAGQDYTPFYQLVTSQSNVGSPGGKLRPTIADLGAFESGSAGTCTTTFYPASVTLPAAGGTATVQVISDANCTSWTASSNSMWITGVTGSGSSTGLGNPPAEVQFSVASYAGGSAQTGSLTIAGQTYNVIQLPPDTTAPTVSVTSPSGGASFTGSSVSLSATASDNIAVASVQFILEPLGCGNPCATYSFISNPLTGSSPYATTTDATFMVTEGIITSGTSYQISAIATDASGNITQATPILVSTPSTTQTETPYFNPQGGTYSSPQIVNIASATSEAAATTIYYTTDGTDPTTSGTRSTYTAGSGFSLSTATTVKAVAIGSGYSTSPVATANYIFVLPPATPTFSPAAGAYTTAQTVTISDATVGSTIYYTTDGTIPSTSSTVYSGAITVSSTETVKAIAVLSGVSSPTASAAYTIGATAATPAFSPAAGSYLTTQTVTISDSTPGSSIYYTTNGTTPTTSSTHYTGAISVSVSETVQAIATASGYLQSAVGSAAYTIGTPTATPTFSPAAGTYSTTQTVTISDSTSGSTIYYTTNGSTPTTSSTVYSGAISVSTSETVQAIAIASGFSQSAVGSAAYAIGTPAATPTFSPAPGVYRSAQMVTISDSTSGSTIYYTTNGSTPTTSSTVYSGPITVSTPETIKAIATASGDLPSAVGSATYSIIGTAASYVQQCSQYTAGGGSGATASCTLTGVTAGDTLVIGISSPSPTLASVTSSSGTPVNVIANYAGNTGHLNAYLLPNTGSGSITITVNETGYYNAVWLSVAEFTNVATSPLDGSGTGSTGHTQYGPGFITSSSFTTTASGDALWSFCSASAGETLTVGTAPVTWTQLLNSTASPIALEESGLTTTPGSYYGQCSKSSSGYDQDILTLALLPSSASSTAATPTFSPAAGTYSSTQTVTLSDATTGSTIYYTTNGTTPTTSSTVYSGPITVSSSETVQAIATASGYSQSAVASAAYTINLPAATPTFSPAAGTYSSAQTVTISDSTAGSTIYYTTNGTTPTTSSTVYSGAITVSASETVKAIATASGYSQSAVGSAAYSIVIAAGSVQQCSQYGAGGGSGATASCTLTGVKAGDALVIGVWSNSPTLASVTSSAGTPVSVIANYAGDTGYLSTYLLPNVASGSITITTNETGYYKSVWVSVTEFTNVAASPLDGSGSGSTGSSHWGPVAVNSSSFTTTASGDALWSFCSALAGETFTVGTAPVTWTQLLSSTPSPVVFEETGLTTSPGTYYGQCYKSNSGYDQDILAVALKP